MTTSRIPRSAPNRIASLRSNIATVLMVGAGLIISSCVASTPGPTSAPPPSGGDITRDARLLQMTDMRKLDTALVDELLTDNNSARRARTALAIGQVKGKARYAKLRQLLVDADTAVAANAAFALGLGNDTTAIVALARAVAGAPDPVAIEAAWSLGDIGDPARSVLTLALGDGIAQPLVGSTAAQRSAPVRAALITATTKLRTIPTATLLPWLNDNDRRVVRAAAYVLGRSRAPGGVRAMITLRNSNDEETRQYVARALAKSAAGDSLAPRALDALNVLVTDTSARVRVNAVRSLATYGASVRETLMHAMKDTDANVRVATTEVLIPLLGRDIARWKSTWDLDSTLQVRILLITGARRAGIAAFEKQEEDWKKSPDWRLRSTVLQAQRVDSVHRPKFPDDALWALHDPDGRVRDAGVDLLHRAQGSDRTLEDSLRKLVLPLLNDPDFMVRSSVLVIVYGTATAKDIPLALDAYARAQQDLGPDARYGALGIIFRAWLYDSLNFSPALRARILAIPVPRDSTEREQIRSLPMLQFWKRAPIAQSTKSLGEYEQLIRRYVVNNARQPTAVIHTEKGDITLALSGREAPITVDNFAQLARRGFYRNTYFHRVVPNFVAQDGDQRGDGTGSVGYAIRDELNRQVHSRGCLAMALSGPDTGGSQYYLCHSPQPHLDGHYTVFGHILQGFDVLDRIVQTDRILSIEIR